MTTQISPSSKFEIAGNIAQAAKQLHRSDKRCRYAMEVGGIGFILLIGMSLFGGGGASHSTGGASASYSPQPTASSQSAPSISQSQLSQIKSQVGGNVINTVPVAPLKPKPLLVEDASVQVEKKPISDSSDSFTYTGERKGPRPVYQEAK